MTNYYDEILVEIKEKMANNDYVSASILIKNELAMPYLPNDFEKIILDLDKEVNAHLKSHDFKLSEKDLEEYLKDDAYHQILAINYLLKLNLRDYYPLLEDYLKSEGDSYAKVLLISGMAEQSLSDSFIVNKDGLEIEFIPMYVEDVSIMDGYLSGIIYLEAIFNQNPSLFKMSKELLIKEAFLKLPLSLEDEEGLLYAKKICLILFEMFGMDQEKKEFIINELTDNELKMLNNLYLKES